ncbi:MAG: OFA family MFS transporter [Desulfobulbaceae bacterium]|nr:OFA family MFS transporter [Desulfobulbaceae bacterium]HIJ89774.1 OFA family MFS transporter [Deltaproteobacteria bacterium]
MTEKVVDRGVAVTMAGTGINLALGVLYAWSIFKGAIKQSIDAGGPDSFAWDPANLNDPYAVCCLVFACSMFFAGRCQDKYGPRLTAIIGGLLVGAGFVLASTSTSYGMWIISFGVLAGMGIAFGYSSATPPALKWFPPNKTGLIAGIVVSGFGLASVYIAPTAQYLLASWGLSRTMFFFGIGFMVVVSLLALLLINPPEGFKPKGFVDRRGSTNRHRDSRDLFEEVDFTPSQILRSLAFWRVWLLYFIGAGSGLMVIGSVAGMAKSSLGANAFLVVAILAVGNAAGRVVAGMLADKLGRCRTMAGMFGLQALMMFWAIPIISTAHPNALMLVGVATMIGFNYGANLSIFPTITKDLWGMKHFGVNYGTLFTAWGLGGFVMSKLSQALNAGSGSFASSFATAGVLLLLGLCVVIFTRDQKETLRQAVGKELRAPGVRA